MVDFAIDDGVSPASSSRHSSGRPEVARKFAWEAFASGLTGVLFLAAAVALVSLFFDGTLSFV